MSADESGFATVTAAHASGNESTGRDRVRRFVEERMARERPPLSRAGLADRAGINRNTVGTFLAGETWPQPARLAAIEQALRLDHGTLERVLTGQSVPDTVSRSVETAANLDEARELVVTFSSDALSDLSPTEREEVEATARAAALKAIREIRGQQ